ncbi:uncharacterized protein V6R79_019859 [Siganus canaliculatus]
MCILFFMVLSAALCSVSSNSHLDNTEILMDNVLVLRVPGDVSSKLNVPLTCGEAYQNQPVFWKKNGEELEPALQGNSVQVEVEEMDGGNYTCHSSPNGEYLNHTMILIQLDPDNRTVILEEKSPEEGHIHCSALNYRGTFHCTWTKTSHRSGASVLLVKAQRYLEKINCELDTNGSGVRCQDSSCPYKEEQNPIALTVYMRSYSRLEAYTKVFYLREIVRPAKLPNLSSIDGKAFTWSYPDSWEKPCTFFGLQFQVKVVSSRHGHSCQSEDHIVHNTTDETQYEVNVKHKKYIFCVRAQDRFTSGPFSPWSQCIVHASNVQCDPLSLQP